MKLGLAESIYHPITTALFSIYRSRSGRSGEWELVVPKTTTPAITQLVSAPWLQHRECLKTSCTDLCRNCCLTHRCLEMAQLIILQDRFIQRCVQDSGCCQWHQWCLLIIGPLCCLSQLPCMNRDLITERLNYQKTNKWTDKNMANALLRSL